MKLGKIQATGPATFEKSVNISGGLSSIGELHLNDPSRIQWRDELQVPSLTETVAISSYLQDQIDYITVNYTPLSETAQISAYLQYQISQIEALTSAPVNHNGLLGLQGGTSNEYYHLTAGQINNYIGRTEVAGLSAYLDNRITNIDVSSQLVGITSYLQSEIDATNALIASTSGNYVLKSGDDMTGPLHVLNTTDSSGTNSGALIVDGGLGVSKNVNIGQNLVVEGNYTVKGTTTFINTQNLLVKDNIITLNVGMSGIPLPSLNSGIEVNRGDYTTADILWDESKGYWVAGISGSEQKIILQSDLNNYLTINQISGISGNLQSQITQNTNTINSLITITGGLDTRISNVENNYTPRSETAQVSAYLQSEINALSAALAGVTPNHNSLVGLQGGTTNQYYHLTAAQSADFIGKTEVAGISAYLNNRINTIDISSQLVGITSYLQSEIDTLRTDLVGVSAYLQTEIDALSAALAGITPVHNNLSGLQGGIVNEYYHLSNSQHAILISGGDADSLHKHYTTGVLLQGVNVDPGYEITLDKTLDYIWSSGRVFGFTLNDNGNGTINLAYGVAMLRVSDTMSPYFSQLVPCKINAQTNIALTDNATNYVYADYNGGSPTINVGTDITTIHATDKVVLYVITRVGTHLDYITVGSYQSDFFAKYAKKIIARNGGAEYAYGCITNEVDTRKLSITSGAYYYVNEQIMVPAFNTNVSDTFDYVYRGSVAGTYNREISGQTTIDNLRYDNGSGTLQTLDNSKYGVHWVYLVLDVPTRIVVVYGQGNYADVSSADAAGIPTDVPPEVRAYSTGVLVAKIIVKKSATNLYSVQNPFTTRFISSVATDHNGLAGLQGGTINEYYHLNNTQYTKLITGTVSSNQIVYSDATNSITGSNNFVYDSVNRRLGISDSASPSLSATIHLSRNTNTGLRADTYSNTPTAVAGLQLFKSRGTIDSPSAIKSGDSVGFIGGYGRGTTAFSNTSRAKIEMLAAENWTDSAQGTYITLSTTLSGSTTLTERMRIGSDGTIKISNLAGANGNIVVHDSDGVLVDSGILASSIPSVSAYLQSEINALSAAVQYNSTHNNLLGLQGGTTNQYYHLSSSQYNDYIGKTEVAGISANLQNRITDNYSTLVNVSGNLQSQINNLDSVYATDVALSSISGGLVSCSPNTTARNIIQPISGGVIPLTVKQTSLDGFAYTNLQEWYRYNGDRVAYIGGYSGNFVGGGATINGRLAVQYGGGSESRVYIAQGASGENTYKLLDVTDSGGGSLFYIKGNQFYNNLEALMENNLTVTKNLTVGGNLEVDGSLVYINTQNLLVRDNIITLNSSVTAGTPILNAGLETLRGNEIRSTLLWDESLDRWTAGISGSEQKIVLWNDLNDYTLRTETASTSAYLQSQINTLDSIYATDAMVASLSANLQTQITTLNTSVIATSAYLQSEINALSAAVQYNSTHNNLLGLQGGTTNEYYHLSASQFNDYIGRTETAAISASLQTQIDNLDLNYATDASLAAISGILQTNITNLNTSVIATSAYLQTQITGISADIYNTTGTGSYVKSTNPTLNGITDSSLTAYTTVYANGSKKLSSTNSGTTTQVLHGNPAGAPSYSAVIEDDITLSDNTTNNATTLKHGFLPRLNGNANDYLNGQGNFTSVSAITTLPGYFSQTFTNQTSIVITHNFGAYPSVQILDNSGNQLIPLNILHNSANQFTVTFSSSQSGRVNATVGSPAISNVTTTSTNYSALLTDNIIIGSAINILIQLPNIASSYTGVNITASSGEVSFTINNHGFVNGTTATITNSSNTTYLPNSSYSIYNVGTNTFKVFGGSGTGTGTADVALQIATGKEFVLDNDTSGNISISGRQTIQGENIQIVPTQSSMVVYNTGSKWRIK